MKKSDSSFRASLWFTVLLLSTWLAGCESRDKILGPGEAAPAPTPPAPAALTVTGGVPVDSATGVAVSNPVITAGFSEPVAPLTGAASFTVTCAAPCVNPVGTVALDATNTTATFTLAPGTVLTPATLYTITVTGARSIATGQTLANPSIRRFTTTADGTLPRVALTVPATTTPSQTGVPVNSAVVVTFTEQMRASSIGATSFTLTCAAPCVSPPSAVTYDAASQSAIFTPPALGLTPASTYTATVTTAAMDLAGNPLAGNQAALPTPSNYIFTFTTGVAVDAVRPGVTSTVPVTTTTGPTPGVATNTAITATFTENLNPATITASSFTVTCTAPCTSPAGTVSYVPSSRTAVFRPTAALATGATYSVTVTTAATDLAGNALGGNQGPAPAASNYIFTFTTGMTADSTAPTVASSDPDIMETGVCTNTTINAVFNEAMDGATVNTSTFTLAVTSGPAVDGVVTYDTGTMTATFDPDANLIGVPSTSYTATIKGGATGVKDVAGNALAADVTRQFTTDNSTCATAPVLGAAAAFGGFGGNATLTNDGLDTVINGDVAVNASSTTITGLRDGGGRNYTTTTDNNGLVTGTIHSLTAPPGSVPGAVVTQARSDALDAFNSISPGSMPGGKNVIDPLTCPTCGGLGEGPAELGGRTLPPGVYLSTTGSYSIGSLGSLSQSLTLDAGGDANAVWVFQTQDLPGFGTLTVGITGPATPATPIQVLLTGLAQAKNVFWYVPNGATIGTGSTMVGTMLADASITLSTTGTPPIATVTTLNGRAIALTAGVTMTNTVVNVPAP